MDNYWRDELRVKCNEIKMEEENPRLTAKVIEAYDRICDYANIGRKEGLLALEEASAMLDLNDDTEYLFFELIRLIVDGTEPDYVKEIGINKCIVLNLSSYLGLINLMYVRGSLMIQAGENPFIIDRTLKSMMPRFITDNLQRRNNQNNLQKTLKINEDAIKLLCISNEEVDENDHSIAGEISKALILLSNKDVQRLLREVENSTLVIAMMGMSGNARTRIFDNISSRLANIIAGHMRYMGSVRTEDIEEDCLKIIKILLKLYDRCEIINYDFSTLKILVDTYTT